MGYHAYMAARYALVGEYVEGHLTFPQYVEQLNLLELGYWFGIK